MSFSASRFCERHPQASICFLRGSTFGNSHIAMRHTAVVQRFRTKGYAHYAIAGCPSLRSQEGSFTPERGYVHKSCSMAWVHPIDFFLNHKLSPGGFRDDGTCSNAKVPYRVKIAFHGFKVKHWSSFEREAAKVLVRRKQARLPDYVRSAFEASLPSPYTGRPCSETSLMYMFSSGLLKVTNAIESSSNIGWRSGKADELLSELKIRIPDFSLICKTAGSSCSQTRDGNAAAIASGLLKPKPCLDLGSRVTADWLSREIQREDFLERTEIDPFYQALSYALSTSRGLGILTNFDTLRFFKVNIGAKEVLMSSVVKVDQLLSEDRRRPHAVQAMLYMTEVPEPSSDEFSVQLVDDLMIEADKKGEEKKKRKDSKNSNSQHSQSKKKKGSGSSRNEKGESRKKGTNGGILSPVSRTLMKCKMMGTIAEGVTGPVQECDFDGLRVAVKMGTRYDPYQDRDCFFHVEHETEMYELLEDLQGSVIPRVVDAGVDEYFTPSDMILITEKVGMAVKETKENIFVGEQELDRENVVLLREKGVEGLEKMHARGVVHMDSNICNIRVDMRDGKVDRVWWVDLGDASVIDEEVGMVWDDEFKLHQVTKEWAIRVDLRRFTAPIDEYLLEMNV